MNEKHRTRGYNDKWLIDLLLQIILFLLCHICCCDTHSLRNFVDRLSRLFYRFRTRFLYIVIAYSVIIIKLDSLIISGTTSDKFLYGDNAILQLEDHGLIRRVIFLSFMNENRVRKENEKTRKSKSKNSRFVSVSRNSIYIPYIPRGNRRRNIKGFRGSFFIPVIGRLISRSSWHCTSWQWRIDSCRVNPWDTGRETRFMTNENIAFFRIDRTLLFSVSRKVAILFYLIPWSGWTRTRIF